MIRVGDKGPNGEAVAVERQGWAVSTAWGVAYYPEHDGWSVTHLPTGRGFGFTSARTGFAVLLAQKLATIHDEPVGAFGGEGEEIPIDIQRRLANAVREAAAGCEWRCD